MSKNVKIALAGNPNSGKTTLFNALTGSEQYVGNWPGVTVEKKDGILAGHKEVVIQDLPGIYSLSPYSIEEKVSRRFLVEEGPDAILNIVDGTNIERNLYLSTQLAELGLPMVMAVNMMDVVRKNGDTIELDFEMIPRRVYANPNIRANRGKIAVTYGPFVYCMEGVDNGEHLGEVILLDGEIKPDFDEKLNLPTLQAPAARIRVAGLYSDEIKYDPFTAKLIPFFAFANRGSTDMRIWHDRA